MTVCTPGEDWAFTIECLSITLTVEPVPVQVDKSVRALFSLVLPLVLLRWKGAQPEANECEVGVLQRRRGEGCREGRQTTDRMLGPTESSSTFS